MEKLTSLARNIKWKSSEIAAPDQIEQALATLLHHFESRGATYLTSIDDIQGATESEDWAQGLGNNEIGIEAFRSNTPEEISRLLGFDDGRPASFARWMSLEPGVSAWDLHGNHASKWEVGDAGLIPLKLKWHQLCGIASMVGMAFTAENESKGAKNILIADDVGIGKTAQLMGIIAFLIKCYFAHEKKQLLPPILHASE